MDSAYVLELRKSFKGRTDAEVAETVRERLQSPTKYNALWFELIAEVSFTRVRETFINKPGTAKWWIAFAVRYLEPALSGKEKPVTEIDLGDVLNDLSEDQVALLLYGTHGDFLLAVKNWKQMCFDLSDPEGSKKALIDKVREHEMRESRTLVEWTYRVTRRLGLEMARLLIEPEVSFSAGSGGTHQEYLASSIGGYLAEFESYMHSKPYPVRMQAIAFYNELNARMKLDTLYEAWIGKQDWLFRGIPVLGMIVLIASRTGRSGQSRIARLLVPLTSLMISGPLIARLLLEFNRGMGQNNTLVWCRSALDTLQQIEIESG